MTIRSAEFTSNIITTVWVSGHPVRIYTGGGGVVSMRPVRGSHGKKGKTFDNGGRNGIRTR